MAVVTLVGELVAGDDDLLGVDDDHEVAGVTCGVYSGLRFPRRASAMTVARRPSVLPWRRPRASCAREYRVLRRRSSRVSKKPRVGAWRRSMIGHSARARSPPDGSYRRLRGGRVARAACLQYSRGRLQDAKSGVHEPRLEHLSTGTGRPGPHCRPDRCGASTRNAHVGPRHQPQDVGVPATSPPRQRPSIPISALRRAQRRPLHPPTHCPPARGDARPGTAAASAGARAVTAAA